MASDAPSATTDSAFSVERKGSGFIVSKRRQLRTSQLAESFCTGFEGFLEAERKRCSGKTIALLDFDISQNLFTVGQLERIFVAFTSSDVLVEKFRIFGTPALGDMACTSLAGWLARVDSKTAPLELHLSDCAITEIGFQLLKGALAKNIAYPRPRRSQATGMPLFIRLENNYIPEGAIQSAVDEGVAMAFHKKGPEPPCGTAKCAILTADEHRTFKQKKGEPPAPEDAPPPKPVKPMKPPPKPVNPQKSAPKRDGAPASDSGRSLPHDAGPPPGWIDGTAGRYRDATGPAPGPVPLLPYPSYWVPPPGPGQPLPYLRPGVPPGWVPQHPHMLPWPPAPGQPGALHPGPWPQRPPSHPGWPTPSIPWYPGAGGAQPSGGRDLPPGNLGAVPPGDWGPQPADPAVLQLEDCKKHFCKAAGTEPIQLKENKRGQQRHSRSRSRPLLRLRSRSARREEKGAHSRSWERRSGSRSRSRSVNSRDRDARRRSLDRRSLSRSRSGGQDQEMRDGSSTTKQQLQRLQGLLLYRDSNHRKTEEKESEEDERSDKIVDGVNVEGDTVSSHGDEQDVDDGADGPQDEVSVDDEDLPEDWEAHRDEESQALYYWNAATGESTWERPRALNDTPEPDVSKTSGYRRI